MRPDETYQSLVASVLAVALAAEVWSSLLTEPESAALAALSTELDEGVKRCTSPYLPDAVLRRLRVEAADNPHVRVARGYAELRDALASGEQG